MTWQRLAEVDDYPVLAGRRYALVCKVTSRASLAKVRDVAAKYDWADFEAWAEGDALPAEWPADRARTDPDMPIVRAWGRPRASDTSVPASKRVLFVKLFEVLEIWIENITKALAPPRLGTPKLSDLWDAFPVDPGFAVTDRRRALRRHARYRAHDRHVAQKREALRGTS